jgi:excinuclease UvrABC helicase subunit UvrB
MNAIAAAMIEVEQGRHGQALRRIHAAIRKIEALEEMEDETFTFEQQRSVLALKELAAQLEQTRPLSPVERLERELRVAVDQQDFERAASLRDRIRALRKGNRAKD